MDRRSRSPKSRRSPKKSIRKSRSESRSHTTSPGKKAYCVRCKRKQTVVNGKISKKGKCPRVYGTCGACHGKISVFVKKSA